MEHVNVITSFIAGFFMFFAPCTLPLVPGFIAFISHGEKDRVLRNSFLFCLGFLVTFLLFGILAGLLGHVLAPAKAVIQKVGAIFVIVLGLYMIGLFKLPFFHGTIGGENLRQIFKGKFSPFVLGVSIALGWSPCVGPVLAGIFFYAAFSYSVFAALGLFFFFSLGFIIPFLVVAMLVKRGKSVTLKSSKWFSILAGALLVFIGVLLFLGDFSLLATWFYKILNFVNYERINNLL